MRVSCLGAWCDQHHVIIVTCSNHSEDVIPKTMILFVMGNVVCHAGIMTLIAGVPHIYCYQSYYLQGLVSHSNEGSSTSTHTENQVIDNSLCASVWPCAAFWWWGCVSPMWYVVWDRLLLAAADHLSLSGCQAPSFLLYGQQDVCHCQWAAWLLYYCAELYV